MRAKTNGLPWAVSDTFGFSNASSVVGLAFTNLGGVPTIYLVPDSTIALDHMLVQLEKLVATMLVYPDRMKRNLDLTRGLVFSGQLLLDLAAAGMLREQAYKAVQSHAMHAWESEGDFRAAVEADPEIRAILTPEKLAESFSLDRQLRNVDKIFARVFPGEVSKSSTA